MTLWKVADPPARQCPQLVMDDRNQAIEGVALALSPLLEDLSDGCVHFNWYS